MPHHRPPAPGGPQPLLHHGAHGAHARGPPQPPPTARARSPLPHPHAQQPPVLDPRDPPHLFAHHQLHHQLLPQHQHQQQQPPPPPQNDGRARESKRQRVTQACDLCNRKKIKCDGVQPSCSNCTGLGQPCTYVRITRKRGPKPGYIEELEARVKELEEMVDNLPPEATAEAVSLGLLAPSGGLQHFTFGYDDDGGDEDDQYESDGGGGGDDDGSGPDQSFQSSSHVRSIDPAADSPLASLAAVAADSLLSTLGPGTTMVSSPASHSLSRSPSPLRESFVPQDPLLSSSGGPSGGGGASAPVGISLVSRADSMPVPRAAALSPSNLAPHEYARFRSVSPVRGPQLSAVATSPGMPAVSPLLNSLSPAVSPSASGTPAGAAPGAFPGSLLSTSPGNSLVFGSTSSLASTTTRGAGAGSDVAQPPSLATSLGNSNGSLGRGARGSGMHRDSTGSVNTNSLDRPKPMVASESSKNPPVRMDLIDTFFTCVHPFLPVLHKATLLANVRAESPLLMNAVYAMGAHYAHPEAPLASQPFYNAARECVQAAIETPSYSSAVGLLILSHYVSCVGQTTEAWVFFGIAVRVAQHMRLHCEPSLERPLPSAFMQEYRRRIWWALYETDRHLAIVSKLPFSIRDSDFRVNYQCSESLWIKFGHGDMYEIAAQMAAAAAQGGHGDAMAIDGPGGAGGHRPVSPGSAYEVHLSPLYMQLLSITSRIVVFERSLMNRQATVYHGGAAAYGASRLGNSSFATTALTSLGPATHLTAETVTPGGVGIGAGALSPPGARTRGGGGGGAGHTERRRGAAAVAAAQAIADSGLDEASRRQMAELEGALNEWFRRAPQWLQTIAPTYSPGLGECASGLPPWKSAFVQIMYHYSRILLHVHSMQWAIGCARGAAAAAATPTQALSAVALDTSYTASVTSAYTISTLVKRFLAHNPDFLYVSPFVSNCMYRAGTVLLQSVQVEPQHEERASRAINAIVHGLSGLSRSSTAAMQDLGSLTDQRQALLRE